MTGHSPRILPAAVLALGVVGALMTAPGASATSASTDELRRVVTTVSQSGIDLPTLGQSGRVRVVIELQGDSVTDKVLKDEAAGRPVTKASRARARAEVRASQTRPTAALSSAGARVERHYVETLSGLSATVRADRIAALRKVPGVVSVRPVTFYRPDNGRSNNYTGASQFWTDYGVTGAGIKVAIIDTGVDYGHADFGGPGTSAYFDSNDSTVIENSHPFPTAKVVGGYDFVGDNYDAGSELVSRQTPVPDPDPLDCNDHGTHVAGTAAGLGVTASGETYSGPYTKEAVNAANLRINPGSAPQASLLAYRVFGCDGQADSSVIIAAIDRAVADGAKVINMSLGSSYGASSGVEQSAIARAVKAGATVVASAGNSGWQPYLAGSPSTAPAALSVAALDAVPQFPGATLSSNGTVLELINANDAALPTSATVYVVPDGSGGIGTGCSAGDYAGASGKIVVTKRGVCDRVSRAELGQAAGAVAVVMVNTQTGLPPFEGPVPGVTIPFLGADQADGRALESLEGQLATLAAFELPNPGFMQPADFTSNGPRWGDAGVKPDVSAPGVSLLSADVGSGSDGLTLSGTSMAAPHTAGIAALVRAKNPTWSGQQVKNAIVNTASTDASLVDPMTAIRTRVGNGLVQPLDAQRAVVQLQASKAGDSGLTFGVREDDAVSARATITVINAGPGEKQVTLTAQAPDGTAMTLDPSVVYVRRGAKQVNVRLSMSKSAVAALHPQDGLPILTGSITASASGAPTVRMPVQVVVYARSAIGARAQSGTPTTALSVQNRGQVSGDARVYEWLVGDGRTRSADVDVRALGFASRDAGAYSPVQGDQLVTMAVSTYTRESNEAANEFVVYLDTDRDGTEDTAVLSADYGLLTAGSEDGTLGSAVIDLATEEMVVYQIDPVYDASLVEFSFLASDLGVDAGSPPVRVVGVEAYPLREDRTGDLVFSDATFNAFSPQRSTAGGTLVPGEARTVAVTSRAVGTGETASLGWMVAVPNNRSGEAQSLLIPGR